MRFRVGDNVSRFALAFLGSLSFGTLGFLLYERHQGRDHKMKMDGQETPWLVLMKQNREAIQQQMQEKQAQQPKGAQNPPKDKPDH